MITIKNGDIFQSAMLTLVNPVNCVGVMGAGLAFQFKCRFPEMFRDYQERCGRGAVRLGEPYPWWSDERVRDEPNVINFPTKGHWSERSRLLSIVKGLDYLCARISEWDISSLAVPLLGCGMGGLSTSLVMPILDDRLERLSIPVEIYVPPLGGGKPWQSARMATYTQELDSDARAA